MKSVLCFLLTSWEVFFSPHGGATKAIIRTLDSARTQVLLEAYSFTSKPIGEAVIRAKKRGCEVKVILDKGRFKERNSLYDALKGSGVPVKIDYAVKLHHSKTIVIDSAIVITGSFNFTNQAETGIAENLLILKDSALAIRYVQRFFEQD